jgi:hypothetical protein
MIHPRINLSFARSVVFSVQATVIMIISYDRKTFVEQATEITERGEHQQAFSTNFLTEIEKYYLRFI